MLVPLKLQRDENDEIVAVKKPEKEFSKSDKATQLRQMEREEDWLIAKTVRDRQREAMLADIKGK